MDRDEMIERVRVAVRAAHAAHALQAAAAAGYGDRADGASYWRCRCGWEVSPMRPGAAEEHLGETMAAAVVDAITPDDEVQVGWTTATQENER